MLEKHDLPHWVRSQGPQDASFTFMLYLFLGLCALTFLIPLGFIVALLIKGG